MQIRLGTRSSALARWQADWVATQLRAAGHEVELVPIVTHGDRQETPLESIGGQGLFTKEIQRALLEGLCDLAVHSLKDLPTDQVPGLRLAAVPERAPCGDALSSVKYGSLDALPSGALVGTGSLRRGAQLLAARNDLRIHPIRGNVDTRLRKLDCGDFDAIVLAEAGLKRLGLEHRITQRLPLALVLPAVGQGALGLEIRDADAALGACLEPLDHAPTHCAVLAERAMLRALHGGCMAPIAAWGRLEEGRLLLTGRVLAPQGHKMVEATLDASPTEAEALGLRVADALRAQGAAELICQSRSS